MAHIDLKERRTTQEETFDVVPLTTQIGAEVLNVDLRDGVSDQVAQALRRAFAKHKVLFFRDQEMDPEGLERFGRIFGPLENKSPVNNSIPGHPNIKRIHFDANSKYIAGETWHSDMSCNPEPPMATGLNLHTVPDVGGDTVFSSMSAAYNALSPAMQKFLDPLTAIHDGEHAYRSYANMEAEPGLFNESIPSSTHPVIQIHPVTNEKCLYVNEAFVTRIVELDAAESRHVLSFLFEHFKNANFQCRFKWRKHSMALWDNRCAQHMAIKDYHPEVRSGFRVTIASG